jgi:poly(3-hydroxybutyrate) depolymerase
MMFGTRFGTLAPTAILAALLIAAPAAAETPPLGSYRIDPDGITVSGVSSGGYMAQQFHVAHSATIAGAGILAAGPYRCAGGGYPLSLYRALTVCMEPGLLVPFQGPPAAAESVEETRSEATRGAIDDPAHMRGDRVYLFSGRLDETEPQSVTDALKAYYEAFIPPENIDYVNNIRAGHAMVTADFGNACATTEPPFINDCGYDAAGALLEAIYGVLIPPVDADGTLTAFDQAEFMADPDALSMGPVGHLYVPKACAAGAVCRLHVAFHGCRQYEAAIGDAFYAHAGYNRWAEANDIIVLYPQTAPKTTTVFGLELPWPNPRGCWDWWGYTGGNYADKTAGQIAAVQAMIDRLSGR